MSPLPFALIATRFALASSLLHPDGLRSNLNAMSKLANHGRSFSRMMVILRRVPRRSHWDSPLSLGLWRQHRNLSLGAT